METSTGRTGTAGPNALHIDKIAYRIKEAAIAAGLGRSTLYEEIAAGRLKSVKAAGRRLILKADLEDFLASCRDAR